MESVYGGECIPGTYCPKGSHKPNPCDPGTYCQQAGLPTPTGNCSAGVCVSVCVCVCVCVCLCVTDLIICCLHVVFIFLIYSYICQDITVFLEHQSQRLRMV